MYGAEDVLALVELEIATLRGIVAKAQDERRMCAASDRLQQKMREKRELEAAGQPLAA